MSNNVKTFTQTVTFGGENFTVVSVISDVQKLREILSEWVYKKAKEQVENIVKS